MVPTIGVLDDVVVVLLFLCCPGDGIVVVARGAIKPTNGVAPDLKGVNRGSNPTGNPFLAGVLK